MAKGKKTGGGSRRGRPNKFTRDEKQLISLLVNFGLERAERWLERVGLKHPARALALTAKFAEFIVPRCVQHQGTFRLQAQTNAAPSPNITPAEAVKIYEATRRPPPSAAPPCLPSPAPARPSFVPPARPAAADPLEEALRARDNAMQEATAPPSPSQAPRRRQHEEQVLDAEQQADGSYGVAPQPQSCVLGEEPFMRLPPGAKPVDPADLKRALARIR